MKPARFICTLIFIFTTLPLAAQEEEEQPRYSAVIRSLGDKSLSISAGLLFPFFLQDEWGGISSFDNQLSLGAAGSLEWNGYLNKQMTLGGQLSGIFAFTPNNRLFTMIPLTVKYSFILDLYPLTIPLNLMAGISFNNLDNLFQLTPFVKPGVTFYWNFNAQWALGLNLAYWWVPENHFGGQLKGQSRFGNFLELSLSLLTHF